MRTSRGRFDVAVTGLGVVTAAGVGVGATWRRVCDGSATATTDPALRDVPVDMSCRVPDFDAEQVLGHKIAWRLDRYVQLALAASREAIADAGFAAAGPADAGRRAWDPGRVAVVLGTGLGGMPTWEREHDRLRDRGPASVSPRLIPLAVPNMAAGEIAMDTGAAGPNLATCTACASGATAIGTARELIRSGAADIVIAGGAEACVSPLVVTGFARLGALSKRCADPGAASRPFDVARDGFVMGEGAGVLVLERTDHARARGARIHASLSGYGASADAYHPTAPDPGGHGVERAVTAALADAGVGPGEVDHVNAHGTSTPQGDALEARTMLRLLGDRPLVTSAKGALGHTLGASGAIEAVLTVLTIAERRVPPTANLESPDPGIGLDVVAKAPRPADVEVALSNSFGFGGQNAVLVLTRG